MPTLPNVSPELIKAYQDEISKSSSASTLKRKNISLNRFFDWAESEGHLENNPLSKNKVEPEVEVSKPVKTKKKIGVRTWAGLGITAGLAVLVFLLVSKTQFSIPFVFTPAKEGIPESKLQTGFNNEDTSPLSSPNPALIPVNSAEISGWNLYAKLKLTDNEGEPRVGSQSLSFKLFKSEASSTPIWESSPLEVSTDSEGSSLISLEGVPSNLFFENKELSLAVIESGQEISDRIPVSTASTPVIGTDGNLILAGESPAIKASNGDFLIEGQTVTIKTTDGGDGNIEINPDGGGITHFLFEGTGQNYLNAQAPNLTRGSLYYGIVANNAVGTGYDLVRLQTGSNPVTRFSVDGVGNTYLAGNLNVARDIKTAGTTRITSGGALTNITGYSQNSGNFTINQNPGDFASIIKKGTALSDVLTLSLDERPKPQYANSDYSTLVLKRYDGSINAYALFVDEGNARFDGQLQLGRFASNPTAIGQGSLVFNTGDNQVYVWNGTTWTAVGSGGSSSFDAITSGTNTTATMVVGTGASLSFTGSGTINASSLNSLTSGQFLRSDTSDNFTSGTLTTDAGTTFDVNGDLVVSDTNITFDGATTAFTTTGDLTLNIGGGDLIFTDTQVFNVGGSGSDVAYNVIGDSVTGASAAMNSDDDLYIEGDLEVEGSINGLTINPGGFTTGSVIFIGSSGELQQDNTNFFFDDSTNRLGIGDNTPAATLTVGSGDLFQVDGATGNITTAGDIAINGGNITSAVTADSTLTVTGTLTANGTFDANGLFTIGDGGETGIIDTSDWDVNITGDLSGIGTIGADGDVTLTQATPSILFVDSTAASDDYSVNVDGSAFTIVNDTDSRTEISFVGDGGIDFGDNTATKTIDIGGVTSDAADTINISTNGTSADAITIGNTNAGTTLSLTGGDDWNLAATGVLTLSASASQTTAIVITDTDYTNALSIADNNIVGTTAAIDFTNFDVATTGNITIAAGQGLDTNGAGAINIGATNATSAVIGSSSLGSLTVTTNSTGDAEIVLPNDSIGTAEINDNGATPSDEYCLTYEGTGTLFEWQNCGSAASVAWSSLTDPSTDLTLTMAAFNTTFNWDPTADSAETNFLLTTQGEDTTGGGDEDQVLLALSQTSNGADVDEAADALLTLANNDANDPVNSAIRFEAGAAGTDFTYGINFDASDIGTAEIVLENAEQIHNQTNGTITFEDGDGTDYLTTTAALTTVAGDLAITGGNITTAVTADSTLTVTGTLTANGTFDSNGDVTIADTNIAFDGASTTFTTTGAFTLTTGGAILIGDGGDTIQVNSSDWDVSTTGDLTGIGTIGADGDVTLTQATPSLLFVDTGGDDYSVNTDGNAFTIVNDSDTRTEITFDGAGAITLGSATATAITLTTDGTGTGEVVLPNDSIGPLEVDDNGATPTDEYCLTYEGTGGIFEWQTCSAASSVTWDTITDPAGNLTLTMAAFNTTFNWDPTADSAETNFSLTTQGEDSTGGGDEDQVLLALTQTSNGADVDEAADALLTFTNNDANDPVNDAIRFDAGAAGVDFADGIDFSAANLNREIVLENGEAIIGQSADTITFEDDDGTDYATLTATALTVTGDLAITGGNITTAVTADSTLTVTGTLTANGAVTLGDGGDAITISGSDTNIAIVDGSTLNIDGDGSPTADLVQIGSGDVSATAGVDALQVTFDSSNASGNAVDITLSGIEGDGTDTTVVIDIDAFTYTSSAGTNVIQGLSVGNLTEAGVGVTTSTAIAIGTGWDNVLSVGGTPVINGSGQVISTQVTGTLFNTAGDTGTGTIIQNDTFAINGGTNGIDTALSGDTFTLNFDSTEVGTTTWGAGSAIVWTFDASGGTDPTLTFGDNLITIADNLDVTLTATENLSISSDLAGTVNVVNIAGTPSGTAGTAYGLYIDQVDSANSNGFDASFVIDNSDTDLAITDGILFVSAGGGFTDFIDTPSSVFKVDGSGNVTGLNFTVNGTTGITFSTTGGINLAGGTISDSSDEVDINDSLAVSSVLQVGGTSAAAYSRFGTATTGHGFTTADDVLIGSDLELDGILYLDGRTIASTDGTATIIFATTPAATDNYNILDNGSWLINNNVNNGIAALMVNNAKAGDLFTASSAGTTKFTIHNDGSITLATDIASTTNTAEGTIFYDNNSAGSASTDHLFLRGSDSAWHRIALDMTKYASSAANILNQGYIEINHNQNTNDMTLTGWFFNTITGLWRTISDFSHTIKHALANEWDSAYYDGFDTDTQSTLMTSLIAYWPLNEASTGAGAVTRADAYSNNHLTDNGTTASGTGKISNGADFESGNSEFLEIADNASLSTGDVDFSISTWVNMESKTAATGIIAGKRDSATVREWNLKWDQPQDLFGFEAFDSGGTSIGSVFATNLGTPSTATWYYIVAWHDSVANTVNIQVNNGPINSTATTGVPADTAANFRMGAITTTEANFFDGLVDEVGFWKKVLSTQEKTDLYNAGYGDRFGPLLSESSETRTTTKLTDIELTAAIDTGTGADGAVAISSDTNINTVNSISGRSCADGGDAVNYSVSSLTATTAVVESAPSTGCLNVGDEVLLINLRGASGVTTNVGNYETLRVSSVASTTVTFTTAKEKYYGDGAADDTNIGLATTNQAVMLQRVPNYTNVTLSNASTDFTPSDWVTPTGSANNGAGEGGVLFFRATGTVTVAASTTINANSTGFIGAVGDTTGGPNAESYEGINGSGGDAGAVGTLGGGNGSGQTATGATGARGGGGGGGDMTTSTYAPGGGGGGGYGSGGGGGGGGSQGTSTGGVGGASGSTGTAAGGGGGGANNTNENGAAGGAGGAAGSNSATATGGIAGSGSTSGGGGGGAGAGGGGGGGGMYGDAALTDLFFGSSGGAGGGESGNGSTGGDGGGIIVIAAETITVSGGIQSNGAAGGTAGDGEAGGGAGGSVLLKGGTVTLGSSLVTATGGAGGAPAGAGSGGSGGGGGGGGVGRIAVEYASAVSGTASPSANSTASGYNTYGLFHSPAIATTNAVDYENLRWESTPSAYGRVEFQTRSGSSATPTDGTWEAWKPFTSGTNYVDLNNANTHTDWSGTAAVSEGDTTRNVDQFEDEDEATAGNLTKITTTGFEEDTAGTLTTSLTSYWPMNETSAVAATPVTRNDVVDTNHLTDNRAATSYILSATGKKSNAADLELSNGNFFEKTDTASLSTGDIDFTLGAWINMESESAGTTPMTIVSKSDSATVREYTLEYTGATTDRIQFILYDSGGTARCTVTANTFGAVTTATWYYVLAWHDATANTCNISINNGTADSAAETGVPADTAANFRMGAKTTTETNFFDGLIDEVGFWKKTLSTTEKANLYDSGNANTYATSGQYAEATITSTNLTNYDYLTAWVSASQTGSTVKVGFGEAAGTEQEETIKIDAASTWQKIYWDLSDIPAGSRDGVTKLRFTNLTSAANTIYIDNIRAERLMVDQNHADITSTPNDFFQYRVIFTTTNPAYQPQVENVQVGYNDGFKTEQVSGLTWTKLNNATPTASDTTSTDGRVPQGTNGTGDDATVYHPEVIKVGSTYKMWYTGNDGSNPRIYYATSPDGLVWTKLDNSIPAASDTTSTNGRIPLGTATTGDDAQVDCQATMLDGSTYKMWYTGHDGSNYRIYYATSSDGLTWTKLDNSIPAASDTTSTNGRIPLGNTGTSDDAGALCPSVILDGSTYKMWYSAFDGSNIRIAYATSSDGLTWTKYDNSVPTNSDTVSTNGRIALGTTGRGDDTGADFGDVIKTTGATPEYRMWYTGNDGTNLQGYYATSKDGLTWNKFNNEIPPTSNTTGTDGRVPIGVDGTGDDLRVQAPAVLEEDGVYKMWYSGDLATSTRNVYYATSTQVNGVRLYNYTGASQELRLDAVVFGADLAEWYTVDDETIGPGDTVSLTGNLDEFGVPVLRKSNGVNDSRLVGIISTRAAQSLGLEAPNRRLLALAGRVPVKIDPDSPAINAGDFLTSSDKPGMARLAAFDDLTIARATEPWNSAQGRGYLLALVNNTSGGGMKLSLNKTFGRVKNVVTGTWEVIDEETGDIAKGIAAYSKLIAANIEAGAIETKEFSTESFTAFEGTIDNLLIGTGLVSPIVETNLISPFGGEDLVIDLQTDNASESAELIVKGEDDQEVATIDAQGNADFEGQVTSDSVVTNDIVAGRIYADEIIARNGYFSDSFTASSSGVTREEIEEMLRVAEEDLSLLAESRTWDFTATDSASLEELAISDLYVTTQAAISALSVSSSITIGTDLVINSEFNSLNTLSAPLSIQSLAMAPVEIMAGKIRIDTNGDVTILGNVAIAGTLEVGEGIKTTKLSTESLVIASPSEDATTSGEITPGDIQVNTTVGKGIIPAGSDQITITNPRVTDYTLIYVTPTSTTENKVLYVKSKGQGFFRVGFTESVETDVNFNWWIVETSNQTN